MSADVATMASIISAIVGVATIASVFLKGGMIVSKVQQVRDDVNGLKKEFDEHVKDNARFRLQASERLTALETKTDTRTNAR